MTPAGGVGRVDCWWWLGRGINGILSPIMGDASNPSAVCGHRHRERPSAREKRARGDSTQGKARCGSITVRVIARQSGTNGTDVQKAWLQKVDLLGISPCTYVYVYHLSLSWSVPAVGGGGMSVNTGGGKYYTRHGEQQDGMHVTAQDGVIVWICFSGT